MQNFENINWHDCLIESVIEIPNKDMLVFNVQYPENWAKNEFLPKRIVFENYYSQEVLEIPFDGNPTILSATVISEISTPFQKGGYFRVKIETNAGDRFVIASSVKLLNGQLSI